MPAQKPVAPRLVRKFEIPKQPEVFKGLQSITGLKLLAEPNVLLAAAMDRRVVCCDLNAEPPAEAPDQEDDKDKEEKKKVIPAIPTTYLSWSHENWVLHLDVHADGKRVATGGADRVIRLWQWDQSKPLLELRGHTDWVRGVAFSPDGTKLASAGDDGIVRLWNPENGQSIATLDGGTRSVESICWTPDGKRLAAGGLEGKLFVWDVGRQELLRSVSTGSFRSIEDEALNGGFSYPSGIRRVACSPDGGQLVAAGLYVMAGFETESAAESLRFEHKRNSKVRYFGAAFDPSGQLLAYSMDETLAVWHLAEKKVTHQIKADQLGLFDICWLNNGRRLAGGGSKGWIGVWDLNPEAPIVEN